MYSQITLINSNEHKNNSIKSYSDFSYAKKLMTAPITVAEFYESCKDYPIIFVKDTAANWTASAMMGYKENENLFIDENGMWEKGKYVPASIRRYPFIFIAQENQQLSLGVDAVSLIIAKEDEERKLFDEKGNQSEFISNVLAFMSQFQGDATATSNFIKQLEEWELLEEKIMQLVTPKGESFSINGFYIINEEKLQHLSKNKKQDICDHNAFPLITSHLISLSNMQRLAIR
jgi:SapC